MKVLVSAYTARPHAGSEAGVGWNWPVAASRHHEVWVLTNTFHQQEIQEELQASPNPNLHFVFHSGPAEDRLWRLARKFNPTYYAAYLLWQASALRRAQALQEEVGFDVAHHLNWATNRFPTFLAWMDIPFIWGPIGGGENAPSHLYRSLGMKPAIGELVRDVSTSVTRFDPLVRRTANRAKAILATSEQTRQALPPESMVKSQVYPAIGINRAELCIDDWPQCKDDCADRPSRLLFVGRLLSWKGCGLAIRTVKRLVNNGKDVELTIVGSGPEGAALKDLASELNVADRVTFTDALARTDVLHLYRTHDIFLFPSLHDSGGTAVLEAMYFSLPVICLDLGGPAESVAEAGIRIPCVTLEQMEEDIAEEATKLLEDPDLRRKIGAAGRRRALDHYDWDKKAEFIRELYESAASF